MNRVLNLLILLVMIPSLVMAAQIVCIEQGTYRASLNNLGDIVAIHEDDVLLTGNGYANFDVIKIKGTAKDVRVELTKKLPDTSLLSEQEIKDRVTTPKYQFKVSDKTKLTVADMCETNVIIEAAK